jgi:N-acetyl-anhydromuramyl-L-alanine amidase AmpD
VERVVAPLRKQFMIPLKNVVGHNDFASYKTCPGTMFDIDKVRQLVREYN